MKILVTAASRHGTTTQIADAIATTLRGANLEVDVADPESVEGIDGYAAVVVGSAVYTGHWMAEAKTFVHRHRDALRERPVFLFSSGPLGDPPIPNEDPIDIADMETDIGAVDHQVFAGRLYLDELSLPERFIVKLVGAPSGDFRPWDDITEWAREIARFVQEDAARVRVGVD